MNEVYLIAGMAVVTFMIRYSLLAIANQFEFPEFLEKALQYVPPAVLAAIIVPSILLPDGATFSFSLTNSYLIGGIAAALAAWLSRNLFATIIVGMIAFLLWRWILLTGLLL